MKLEPMWCPPVGERIVSMVPFKDHVYLATDCNLYRLTKNDLADGVNIVKVDRERRKGEGKR